MKRNYWKHRIDHEYPLSLSFLKAGFLPIGFFDILNEKDFIKKSLATDRKSYFDKIFEDYFEDNNNGKALWNFIAKMKKGDIVVVPLPKKNGKQCIIICELTGDIVKKSRTYQNYLI
ncbi:MAG: hypothetical protein P1P64_06015 [Treponemataceae bacterium]